VKTEQYVAVPPGVGKSHLAVALGMKAIETGHRVLFLTLETLITPGGAGRKRRIGWNGS
jgi:hypothetical protein